MFWSSAIFLSWTNFSKSQNPVPSDVVCSIAAVVSAHPGDNSSRRFFAFCNAVVRDSRADLNLPEIFASWFCSDTTMTEECCCSCDCFPDPPFRLTNPFNCALARFNLPISCLIMYVNSWISTGLSLNKPPLSATTENSRNETKPVSESNVH